ncbi:hypothetical protein EUGRSUZ_E00964 [Eucalyptus grandis]|uniref:Uncharacterized protein n=2 Tax=Eucalyptus grandis TaxID=71139 RepID=A0ACC3KPX2_EUCGR|nr:hypothetical protein EUGRSUZ_E00964 [Eucalyptus grandis]
MQNALLYLSSLFIYVQRNQLHKPKAPCDFRFMYPSFYSTTAFRQTSDKHYGNDRIFSPLQCSSFHDDVFQHHKRRLSFLQMPLPSSVFWRSNERRSQVTLQSSVSKVASYCESERNNRFPLTD